MDFMEHTKPFYYLLTRYIGYKYPTDSMSEYRLCKGESKFHAVSKCSGDWHLPLSRHHSLAWPAQKERKMTDWQQCWPSERPTATTTSLLIFFAIGSESDRTEWNLSRSNAMRIEAEINPRSLMRIWQQGNMWQNGWKVSVLKNWPYKRAALLSGL